MSDIRGLPTISAETRHGEQAVDATAERLDMARRLQPFGIYSSSVLRF
jgi:hypothetical protein